MNINFKKINLAEILEFLAKRFFWIFLILSLLAFLLTGIVFYKYGYSVENSKLDSNEKDLKINADSYQKMINFWQSRQSASIEVETKQFKDPFLFTPD